jgi:hypothetical protein
VEAPAVAFGAPAPATLPPAPALGLTLPAPAAAGCEGVLELHAVKVSKRPMPLIEILFITENLGVKRRTLLASRHVNCSIKVARGLGVFVTGDSIFQARIRRLEIRNFCAVNGHALSNGVGVRRAVTKKRVKKARSRIVRDNRSSLIDFRDHS